MSRAVRLTLLAAACGLLLAVPSAHAASGPCLPEYPAGAQCKVWKGKVRSVNDGDTLDASVPGDGLGGLLRVRIIGAQAMEQTSYSSRARAGDCHAVDATDRLEQLVRRSKGRIRVASLFPESRSRGRRLRSVAVRRGGRWRDVARILISEGHALWWPGQNEDAGNVRYSILAQKAAATGRGLFAPNACGIGPNDGQNVRLWVNWDADGNDSTDPNGEWVRIRNYDPVNPLPLDGWYLRDSGLRRFTFPPGATIPPLGTVTVYAGEGGHFGSEFYWGLRAPVFENVSRDDRGIGDGAYLFDPHGDIRAWMIYPCRVNCTDPAQGSIELTAQPRGDEYIAVRNIGPAPLQLENYELTTHPYGYAFAPDTTLGPGETIRVHTEGDPADDTQFDKHWGFTRQILNNGGDSVSFRTYNDIGIACSAYGSQTC
jgi:endonuclease YncB( thermonuclease family)